MNILKNAEKITAKIKERILSNNFMESNRTSKNYFIRKRKLPFVSLTLFMLNLSKQTLQKELTQFVRKFSQRSINNITKSAFSQSRMKLKPEAFIDLNDVLIKEFYTDNNELRWMGFRLLSIDSSTIDLPNSQPIVQEFGCCHNTGEVITPKARISSCYDLLNELIIDTPIKHYNTGEYKLAIQSLPKCGQDDLLIMDRGFGAIWFMYLLISKGLNFVIRIQRNFITEADMFLDSDKTSQIIEIKDCHRKSKKQLGELGLCFKPIKIRLVKVELDNGEIEILATSLLDENEFGNELFKDLYFRRWGIEINIDHLKNNIEIENFTGLSAIAVRQDFYANAFINNLQSIIARDVQPAINEAKKRAQHNYKVNRNLSLGYMKDRVVRILTDSNPKYMDELKVLFKIEPVPIRKGRKNPRNFHKLRRKFNMNNRRAV